MSFIAGYIAGLEGGETYYHENKTITENGMYVPENSVRWESVVVNVDDRYDEGFKAGKKAGYEEGLNAALSDGIKPLIVTENGTYTAADHGAVGFDPVNVNVSGHDDYLALKKQIDDMEKYLPEDNKPVYDLMLKGVEFTAASGGNYSYRIRYDATDSKGDGTFERDRFTIFITNVDTGETRTHWTTVFTNSQAYEYSTARLTDCFYIDGDQLIYKFQGGSYYAGVIDTWGSYSLNF